jgi:hypothetical protein
MAVPIIESTSSAFLDPAGTTLTVNKPSGVVIGNLMIATIGVYYVGVAYTLTPPSGWTVAAGPSNDGNNGHRIVSYYKIATDSEPASYDWGLSTALLSTGSIVRITGHDAIPIDATPTVAIGSNSSFQVFPAVTTITNDCLIYRIIGFGAPAAVPGLPAGHASVIDVATTTSPGSEHAIFSMTQAVAGDTGTVSTTSTGTAYGRSVLFTIPIKPLSVLDTTPPTLSNITIPTTGTTITATLDETGCLPASGVGGFTLSGTSVTVTSWAISGTTLTLTLSGTIYSGSTVTISYARTDTTDDIHDASTNYLVDFSNTSVTNNSTVIPPLIAGVASFISSGDAGISITSTDASGGSTPYTYQWQRNSDGGSYSDLTDGGGVSGATTLTLTDDSVVSDILYGYKLVFTDNSSATATSNAITAQRYNGGPLTGGGYTYSRSRIVNGC